MQDGRPLERNYCLFWLKERTGYYIEEFAEMLRGLLQGGNQAETSEPGGR